MLTAFNHKEFDKPPIFKALALSLSHLFLEIDINCPINFQEFLISSHLACPT